MNRCTRQENCLCPICRKQAQIIQMLDKKQPLEWFGKKKPFLGHKIQRQFNLEMQRNANGKAKRNKKNQSQNFVFEKKLLECNSSYQKNFDKKQTQKTEICQPESQLRLNPQLIDCLKTNYHDSYKLKGIRLQKQKLVKRLEQKFDLPFIGKSSYKQQFPTHLISQRQKIIKPRNLIKTLELDIKSQKPNHSKIWKAKDVFGPSQPFKPKGHLMKSNSFTSAYHTFYKNSFDKEFCEVIENEPDPEFLRRSKFGSLSKARWFKRLNGQLKRQSSLDLYK